VCVLTVLNRLLNHASDATQQDQTLHEFVYKFREGLFINQTFSHVIYEVIVKSLQ